MLIMCISIIYIHNILYFRQITNNYLSCENVLVWTPLVMVIVGIILAIIGIVFGIKGFRKREKYSVVPITFGLLHIPAIILLMSFYPDYLLSG